MGNERIPFSPPARSARRPAIRYGGRTPNFPAMKKCLLPSLLVLAFGAGNAIAQKPEESRDETMRKLLARMESLEAEVRQLRAEKARAPRSGSHKEVVEAVPAGESKTPPPDESALRGSFPQLKIRGFGDVSYHWADRGPDKSAFKLGQFDLFITSQLAENLSVLAETVIEADENDRFGIEIERLLLQYSPREYFKIAVGR